MKNRKLIALALSLGVMFGSGGFGLGSGVGGIGGIGERVAYAESAGSVVINEVDWAGSSDNSNDEWIELYNTTSQSIDISGWYIEDDYVDKYTVASGTIPAHGYFLIEDSENVVSNVTADSVIAMSLANSGDSLILKTATGTVIDSVVSGGGAWYAGDNTSKATMERKDPLVVVDSAANFDSATSGNGAKSSLGTAIIGTPRGQNSVYQGSVGGTAVEFDLSNDKPVGGSTITATAIVTNVSNLFSYGFDVVYNPAVLEYASVSEDGFLSGNGQTTTAFNAALENGQAGKLVVGNSRISSTPSGVSGSGNLFTMTFHVIGNEGTTSDLSFGGGSFISDVNGDVLATMTKSSLTVSSNQSGPATGLAATLGTSEYSFNLAWVAPSAGADNYLVFRKKADGSLVQIGSTSSLSFVDDDSVNFGGKIVPGVTYTYQIKAVKNGIQSAAVEKTVIETRGLRGDNNRSKRVDGRDIENLAKHYGNVASDTSFDALVDTTFDGVIDGSDLIDIGANFALTTP